MGLSLLVPAFLVGILAVAIPILAHLRQRERREPVRFPSLMFLRRIPHRTVERRRVVHPLLLALRALALALLALAFARPFLTRGDDRPPIGTVRRALVVLVDRSLSMGYRGVWPRALDSARAAIATLGSGDQAALIAFDDAAEVIAPLGEPAAVAARLGALAPTGRGTRIATALRAAREVALRAEGRDLELVLISDLQRTATTGLESVELPPKAALRVVSVAEPNASNARVVDVDLDRRTEGTRSRLVVSASVAGKGLAGKKTTARLIVNGRTVATEPVSLAAGSMVTVRFDSVRVAEGDAEAAIALDPDLLPADDTLRFSIESSAGSPVFLLRGAGDGERAFYLERALSISRKPMLTVITRRGSLSNADRSRAKTIVVTDPAGLTSADLRGLEDFVEKGGGLLVFAPADGRAVPRVSWWPGAIGKLITRLGEPSGHLGKMNPDHPILEPFKDALVTDVGAARFFRYREVVADSTATIVARFDDGRPALIEGARGEGRVLIAAMSPEPNATDLPLQPVFLPLVHRMVGHAGQIGEAPRWLPVGAAVPVPRIATSLTILAPTQPPDHLPPDTAARTISFKEPGWYQIRADIRSAPLARFAVNPPPEESDLTAVEPSAVSGLLRPSGDTIGVGSRRRLTVGEQERAQSWWVMLVAVALLLLGTESIYAARIQRANRQSGGVG